MAVRRYRSIADVPAPPPARTPLEGLTSACELSELGRHLGSRGRAPRGVRRFRSIETLDEHRNEWEAAAPGT